MKLATLGLATALVFTGTYALAQSSSGSASGSSATGGTATSGTTTGSSTGGMTSGNATGGAACSLAQLGLIGPLRGRHNAQNAACAAGAAPALTDAIGGQIDGVCDSAASASQAIDDKLVRGLVVGSTVRLSTLPDLPMSSEAGLPDFEAQGWNGLFAPKGTPAAIIAKLNAAARTAVESEAVKKRFHDLSTVAPDANELAPEVLGQLVTRDVAKYKKLLEEKK